VATACKPNEALALAASLLPVPPLAMPKTPLESVFSANFDKLRGVLIDYPFLYFLKLRPIAAPRHFVLD
jgi:hypothetical protein